MAQWLKQRSPKLKVSGWIPFETVLSVLFSSVVLSISLSFSFYLFIFILLISYFFLSSPPPLYYFPPSILNPPSSHPFYLLFFLSFPPCILLSINLFYPPAVEIPRLEVTLLLLGWSNFSFYYFPPSILNPPSSHPFSFYLLFFLSFPPCILYPSIFFTHQLSKFQDLKLLCCCWAGQTSRSNGRPK